MRKHLGTSLMKSKYSVHPLVKVGIATSILTTVIWLAGPMPEDSSVPGDSSEADSAPALVMQPAAQAPDLKPEAPSTLPAPTVAAAADASPDHAMAQFGDWFTRYQQEIDPAVRAQMEGEGAELARQRRDALARLIEE